ncbi:hypothetical protein GCM10028805_62950 [Spirosoma harenae]
MSAQKAIQFHNTIAAAFGGKYESSKAFQERFRVWNALFERYIKSTDQVIDLGCGTGNFSNHLAGIGCQVIGVDGSVEMIRLCNRNKGSDRVHYVLHQLPLPDSSIFVSQDVVIMSSLLEYIDDVTGMLQQAREMLRPGGLLIVSVPNCTSIYRKVERLLFLLTGRPVYLAYSRHSSEETSFNQQLISVGFEPVDIIYFSGQDPISRMFKPFLASKYVNNLFVGIYRKQTFWGNDEQL